MANAELPLRPSQFERRLQTALSSVAVVGMIGIGSVVVGIPAQNATVNIKLEQMQGISRTSRRALATATPDLTLRETNGSMIGGSATWKDA